MESLSLWTKESLQFFVSNKYTHWFCLKYMSIARLKMKGSNVTSEHLRSLFMYLHATGAVMENLVSKQMTMKTTQVALYKTMGTVV